MSGTRFVSTKAPATKGGGEGASLGGAALVVCSYGSGAYVPRDRLSALGAKAGFAETASATLFGTPRIEEVVGALCGAPRIEEVVVVPLFMARGVTYDTLKDRLATHVCRERVVLCPELGRHPDLARRVADHARGELADRGWRPEETGVVLVGHGSPRNPASGRATLRLAREVDALALFAHTGAAFLEERPNVEEAVRACPMERVLAIGCFTEAGLHATRDVPRELRESGRAAAYGGAIGACDWVDLLVLDQAKAGLRRRGRHTLPGGLNG